MNKISLVRKFLVLILAFMLLGRSAQVVYAQSFWSIYDEEEERKQKEAEEKARAEEAARRAAQEAAKRAAAEAEAKRKQEQVAADAAAAMSESTDWSFSFPETPVETEVSSPITDSYEEPESEKVSNKSKKSVVIKPNPDFAASIGTGVNLLQSPYTCGIHLGGDFLVTKMLEPFFYGGGFRVNVGFPKEDFPYTYDLADGSKDTPYLMGGNLTGIFGITYTPFQNNLKILLSSRLGLQLSRLVSFQTSAASNVHAGLFASFTGGVTIHEFEISITTEYDGIGKISPGLYFAYRIPINLKKGNTGGTEKSHENL